MKKPSATYRLAWEAATEADEVPLHVWHPRNRKYGRPLHSMRAAFDAHLMTAGVAPDVVDFLVGRSAADVRTNHYRRDLMAEAKRAVGLVPPIDWGEHLHNVLSLASR